MREPAQSRSFVSSSGPGLVYRLILADAARLNLRTDARQVSGNVLIDNPPLAQHGVTEFDRQRVTLGSRDFSPDFFVD